MPMFEYICRGCSRRFEQLLFGSETPSCPACRSRDLEKQVSAFAVRGGGSGEEWSGSGANWGEGGGAGEAGGGWDPGNGGAGGDDSDGGDDGGGLDSAGGCGSCGDPRGPGSCAL